MTDVRQPHDTSTREPRRLRRRALWTAAAVAVGVVAFVLVWFQPQKLFVDDRVDEAIPTAAPTPTVAPGSDTTSNPPAGGTAEPAEAARGGFVSLDHSTTGIARVLELPDGRRVLRLEGLDTANGPDLYLYLTATAASGDEATFDDEYVSLGRLKGNQGDQNYDLPPGTDLARYATVVIWCDRFDSAFGAADLTSA